MFYQERVLIILRHYNCISIYCSWLAKLSHGFIQGLLRVQGRPAVSYDDQGMVFAVASGGHVRMFDARKFEKVGAVECVVLPLVQPF